ncbi:MAG TPA: methylmalonyl Co-A mutase-associated GTPase MeaB, partial [Kofleriaceae bacterium]
ELVRTVATRGIAAGSGIAELAAAIAGHRTRVATGAGATTRAAARAGAQLAELVRGLLADRAARALEAHGGLTELAAEVAERRADPWTLAEQLVAGL